MTTQMQGLGATCLPEENAGLKNERVVSPWQRITARRSNN